MSAKRHPDFSSCPRIRGGRDVDESAQCSDPLWHAFEAKTFSFKTWIETNSVVVNATRYRFIISAQFYLYVVGLAVGNDFVYRFLRDAIQRKCDRGLHLFRQIIVENQMNR